jgi:hypothetical protein
MESSGVLQNLSKALSLRELAVRPKTWQWMCD